MSSKKFGYKKYLKPKEKKDIGILKLFCCTFVLMLVVFTVIVNCFTPDVDVSIGNTEEVQEPENNIYLKKFVDNRLLEIQQEDQRTETAVSEPKTQDTITDEKAKNIIEAADNETHAPLPPVELNVTVPEIKIVTPQETVKAAAAPVSQELELTYRVYIGHYNTYDQVKIAKDIVNETDPALQPVIKEVSGGYTLQAGVFKNKNAAMSLTTNLLNEHLPARMVSE